MNNVLIINSSARTLNSHSRKLTEVFTDQWKSMHPDHNISYRELGNTSVPHISQGWIKGAFTPEALRTEEDIETLRISNEYISELRNAHIIVLGAPMYNWSIPSSLKAWIDQVMRVNETFRVDPSTPQNPYIGLLENKRLFLLLSRGDQGYEPHEHNEHMNFQSRYLKTIFGVMGISDVTEIAVSGTALDPGKLEKSVEKSHQDIREQIEQGAKNKEQRIKSKE